MDYCKEKQYDTAVSFSPSKQTIANILLFAASLRVEKLSDGQILELILN